MPKKKNEPKQTLYKVVFPERLPFVSASDQDYWNHRIVSIFGTSATLQESPTVAFGWGVFVSDGKRVFPVFHSELEPYTGNVVLGRKDPELELEEELEEEFEEAIAH